MNALDTSTGFELSVNQKEMWAFSRHIGNYYSQMVIQISGPLLFEKLLGSIEIVIKQQEILSYKCYKERDSAFPFQISDGNREPDIQRLLMETDDWEKIAEQAGEFLMRPYDPGKNQPVRFFCAECKGNISFLFIKLYAFWADNYSCHLFYQALCREYFRGAGRQEKPDIIEYSNFSKWQNELIGNSEDEGNDFWRKYNFIPKEITLPFGSKKAIPFSHKRRGVEVIAGEKYRALRDLSFSLRSDIPDVLFGIFAIHLGSFTDKEFTIGFIPFKRNYRELDETFGLISRPLPVRFQIPPEASLEKTAGQIGRQLKEISAWSDYFHLAVEEEKTAGGLPAFSYCFEYIEVNEASLSKPNGFSFESDHYYSVTNPFCLKLVCLDDGQKVSVGLYYDQNRFTDAEIGILTAQLSCRFQKDIGDYPVVHSLTAAEQNIIDRSNETFEDFDTERSVPALFEEQAKKTPDDIALLGERGATTYKELDARSNLLASHLAEQYDIKPGDLVVVLMERSEWLPIALLGIWKAAAAYVPIDPDYPLDRIKYILDDCKAKIVVSEGGFADKYGLPPEIATVDVSDAGFYRHSTRHFNRPAELPGSLAYIIYTSGSTGKPKGCMISHRSLSNYIQWANRYYFGDGLHGNWSMLTSISFDLTLTSLYTSLTRGKTLFLADGNKDMTDLLTECFNNPEIDTVKLTPSHISLLKDLKIGKTGIRNVICGGEQLTADQVSTLWQINSDIRIYNEFGPTETTVGAIVKEILRTDEKILIGRPIGNTRVYILDEDRRQVPVGMLGEIFIGGKGVGEGYLGRTDLSNERFLIDPFRPGERMYKTGDFGRWLPDGNIEYTGRKDDQIKIRGYRIEPGEIESTLVEQKDIDTAVVIATAGLDGEKELTAYFTAKRPVDPSEIKTQLYRSLPSYMVPYHFVQLPAMPLTPNGKIDKAALPDPIALAATQIEYIAPSNAVEEKLLSIWRELLGKDRIGIKENFFALGGHSLKATRLASQIRKAFDVKISLKDIFAQVTAEQQAQWIVKAQKESFTRILPVARQTAYPLSAAQRRIWVISQSPEANIAYNMPGAYLFEGNLDLAAFESSLLDMIGRHESLRTVFREEADQEVKQYILPLEQTGFRMNHLDFRQQAEKDAEREKIAEEYINEEALRAFDLTAGPLIQAGLYRIGDDRWIFSYVIHHIVCDGWSMGILIKELLLFYRAHIRGEAIPLSALRIQYKDFTVWQQEQLGGESLQAHKAYWLKEFEGELPILQLPSDNPRPAIKTYNAGTISRQMNATISQGIKSVCQQEGGTLFMGLLSAVNILLYRYTNQEDIIIGCPVAGREHADLEDQIGFYVNTLALRTRFSGTDSFRVLLTNVRAITLAAYEHQIYPFDELINGLNIRRDPSRSVLFDVMIMLENTDAGSQNNDIALEDIRARGIGNAGHSMRKFDLTFNFAEIGDQLRVSIDYNADIFNNDSILRMAEHLERLIDAVLENPELPVCQLNYLNDTETETLLNLFNDTGSVGAEGMTVIDLFEEQTAQIPDHIAIVYKDKQLTYDELNQAANRFGHYLLRHHAIRPDDLIGVKLERSEWMIIAIIGILKAGGAYVPIDTAYPSDRIAYMINDSSCKVLIDQEWVEDYRKAGDDYGGDNLPSIGNDRQLAYVIYTSGTTGNPKGVMIEHGSLVSRICYFRRMYDLTRNDCMLFYRSYSFDGAIEEYLLPLAIGAKCIIAPSDFKEDLIGNIMRSVRDHGITKINMPPALLNEFTQAADPALLLQLLSLKHVVSGGDKLTAKIVDEFLSRFNIHLYNSYGPTENTIDSTNWLAERRGKNTRVLIGKPVPDSQVFILDKSLLPVPVGIYGEIYVGGTGLARGYLKQPLLTSEKFISNPFRNGDRMYRTGDIGRWTTDGQVEFAGRTDDQVKIRGYRIELGEIENALHQHPQISAAVVTVRSGSGDGKELVAYIVSGEEIKTVDIRSYLGRILPAYMLPAQYVRIAALPMTRNGKVDKSALPDPSTVNAESGFEHVEARNGKERQLIYIFEEVLKKKPIGIKDDFFMLGGDSIKSIQIVSRLRQKGYKLSIRDVLQFPVIEDLAECLVPVSQAITQESTEGIVPFSPIQTAFFNSNLVQKKHYNQSVLLTGKGSITEDAIKNALDKIILHHDTLRSVFSETPEGWIQEIKGSNQGCSFEIIPVEQEHAYRMHCDRIQSEIDITSDKVFSAALFRRPDGDRLLLVAHHLVVDGVSWRILLEDLFTLYQQGLTSEPLVLPLKTDAFSRRVAELTEYATCKTLQAEEKYWSAIEAASFEPLPADHPAGSNEWGDVAASLFTLDESATEKLLTRCHHAYHVDINDILLTALSLALGKEFGLGKVLLNLEGHGREPIGVDTDVSRTVGWFTTVYPVAFDVCLTSDVIRQLVSVKETLHRVPAKGIGYGILRYLTGKAYVLTPQITFNYLGDVGTGVGKDGKPLFGFSGDYRGKEVAENNKRASLLDISGIVVDGKMHLSIAYSDKQFTRPAIERLIAAYKYFLTELIDELSNEDKTFLSPVDLTYKGLSMDQLMELNQEADIEDVYPLSPLQEGLYFHWLKDPGSPVYFEQMSYRVKGRLEIDLLKQSYRTLIHRHAILRTSFSYTLGEKPLQIVHKDSYSDLLYLDISGEPGFSIEEFKREDRSNGFDLHDKSQIRLTILELGDDIYEFIWSHHHILMDGWCGSVLIREFFQLYYGLLRSELPDLNKVHPYATFIEWLMQRDRQHSLQYWKKYLSGYDTVSTLPAKSIRQKGRYISREATCRISGSIRRSITAVCAGAAITENTFIQAAWGILLARYNNTDDVVFGSVVSGRPAELRGIEEMIGLFINTIPVRIHMEEGLTVRQLLKTIQEKAIAGSEHHYSQLADIQSDSGRGRELFDHVLVFENYPVREMVEQTIDSSSMISFLSFSNFEQANYDFSIMVVPGDTLQIRFIYNTEKYEDFLMDRVRDHFFMIVSQLVERMDSPVHNINFLLPEEERQLLATFNDTEKPYPVRTLLQLFEEQAEKTPDATAVVYESAVLSYKELNEMADKMGHYLQEKYAVKPDDLIGIRLPRTEWAVISILGVLKSGGAFVPVDPEYPEDRIAYMMNNSKCLAVIDEEELGAFRDELKKGREYPGHSPASSLQPEHLAYVIYTSGSTGKPKGVMIRHATIVNTMLSQKEIFDIRPNEKGLQFASLSFDASVAEIFYILIAGATLYIFREEDKKDPVLLEKYISENDIDLACIPPTFLNLMEIENIKKLRRLITAGEQAIPGKALSFLKYGTYYNAYGPTESSICAAIFRADRKEAEKIHDAVPIGIPIANTQLYILDDWDRLMPAGVQGEICIGGSGLSKGYLNQPELTAQKFVKNPFKPGERMYRTGDIGKWLPDGNLVFLGRKDEQVKIRGYRVEPGEIENIIQQHPDIDSAVVVAREDKTGEKVLIAYLVGQKVPDVSNLRSFLSKSLPHFMIPAYFIHLAEMPLTPNAKVDRKSLPAPQGLNMEISRQCVAPRNSMEERLVAVWQELLEKDKIGIEDNFFEAGGNSIKIIRLAKLAGEVLEKQISITTLFRYSSIKELVDYTLQEETVSQEPVFDNAELAEVFNKFN